MGKHIQGEGGNESSAAHIRMELAPMKKGSTTTKWLRTEFERTPVMNL